MSIAINLGIGLLAGQVQKAAAVADQLLPRIAVPFTIGSGHDIVLSPHVSTIAFGPEYAGAISCDELNIALEKVTGRQRDRTKVTNIGLLIADRYEPRPDFFGYMFDQDFSPGTSDPWTSTPREGCAIFLEGIADRREGKAFMQEVSYTAVHEVGHIFNLQHSSEPSYMAQSADRPTPFPLDRTDFNEKEKFLLSKCSSSRCIWPGGSGFGDLGELGVGQVRSTGANAVDDLVLKISVDRDEFWPYEPVELDIAVRHSPKSTRRSASVPDMIDPGYQSFVIWIEDPSGERRRYRSPRHYCTHDAKLPVPRQGEVRRDLSIFGQAGGFTFCKVGRHRLFAEFSLGRSRVLRSNLIEVDILRPSPSDAFYRDSHSLFTDRHVGQLMYHRRLTARRSRELGRLISFGSTYPTASTTAMIHYAVGRALASSMRRSQRLGQPTARLRRESINQLRMAAKHPKLGLHRRAHADHELTMIDRKEDGGTV